MTCMILVERPSLGSIANYRFTGIDDEGIGNLVGKVLTQLEASIPEGTQLTALKSILQQTIYSALSHGHYMAYSIKDESISEGDNWTRKITVTDPWENSDSYGQVTSKAPTAG